jgi:hypothetical protein
MGSTTPQTPYWNINVPPSQHTDTCPDFLLNLPPKDLDIISTPDSAFRPETWPQVQKIIADNRLELFRRVPSHLRRYRESIFRLRKSHGSVMDYVVRHRLRWEVPIVAKGKKPFEEPGDYKILWNDWPYGIDERIVHLVVWTKFALEDDPATGDLTERARGEIEAFVARAFRERMQGDRVGLSFVCFSDYFCYVDFFHDH